MNDFARQMLKFWNELGLNQKVSLIVVSALVMAGMAGLVMWSGQPDMRLLYGGLDTKDMADVVHALDEQAIPYEIRNGASVYVPSDYVHKVRMDLASRGLPSGGGIGFEIFDRTSFGISDFVQRTNYNRAVQGELQRTISQLRGVRSARVMIVIPQNRLLVNDQPVRSTASVMVDTGGLTLERDAVNSIRFLVANSVEGLAVNDVVVVDAKGTPLSQDLAQDEVVGAASGQFKFRKSLEDYFTQKVESMLARVVGQQNVVARVSVELDTEASTVTEERFDPAGQVVRTQTQNDEINRSLEARRDDTVGVPANTPDGGPAGPSGQTQNTTEESRKNRSVTYEINRTTSEVVKAPGGVRRLSAAVFIAKRYEDRNGTMAEAPRNPQEIESLRQMVINALGVDPRFAGGDAPIVTLAESDFVPPEDLAAMHPPSVTQEVMKWVDILRNFVAVGFAAIMFLIFLRMLKRHKPEPISLEVVEENGPSKKGGEVVPRLTPELLNELIREKPENVSTALRNWALEAGNTNKN